MKSVDSDKFLNLTEKYWDKMYRFAISLTGNIPEAEDLTQTSLVKAIGAFPKFIEDNSRQDGINEDYLRNWLLKIVKNSWLDVTQQRKRWVYDDDGTKMEKLTLNSSQETAPEFSLPSEEAKFYKLALDDRWAARLQELTPRQRSVLFLAANDYAYKEIAAILDIPIGTVMSTLSRTLQKLRKD